MKALVLSTNDYRSFPSRKQRFAGCLASLGMDVLYVEAPVTWLAALRPGHMRKLLAWREPPRLVAEHTWTISPSPWLPLFKRYERIADYNARRYRGFLDGLEGNWMEGVTVVLSYLPFIPDALTGVPAPVIYDCVDDHAAYPGLLRKETVDRLEARTARMASAVIATNQAIAVKLAEHASKLTVIANGVDYELFAAPARTLHEGAALLERSHRFLYAGAMREWFDVDAVAAVAVAFPSFVLDCYGLAMPAVRERLAPFRNVRLLGTVAQNHLAQVAPGYDLALIPFTDCPLTSAVDPLKFYEYTAAGLPVVAGPIDALGAFDERQVMLAGSPREYVEAVQAMLDADTAALRRFRTEDARRFDWSLRLAEFRQVVTSVM